MPIGFLIFFAFVAVSATVIGAKFYFDRTSGPSEVTWTECIASIAAIAILVCPLVGWVGVTMAKKDNVTFHEFLNGWEVRARYEEIVCTEDGACSWEYDCDPYVVPVTYECGDSKTSRTCTRYETHYHSCPYVTSEYNYSIDTTLGNVSIDTHRFPADPQRHRWEPRRHERLPRSIVERAGVGEPPFWSAARDRIARGDPGPVTKVHAYDNFILASHYTILKRYRKEADEFRARQLLPDIASSIRVDSFYRSDKVSVIKCPRVNVGAWNDSLEKFNAALGSELRGDMRLVLVCDAAVNQNPDAYQFALQAYWQDTEVFRRTALPKNTITVIVGSVDGRTVAWARVFTGMPVGNSLLSDTIRTRFAQANQILLTPDSVIGTVVGRITDTGEGQYSVSSLRQGGVLSDVVWGTSNRATRFSRVSMKAKDKDDIGTGFNYLATEVVLSGVQKALIILTVSLISLIVAAVIAFNDFFNAKRG